MTMKLVAIAAALSTGTAVAQTAGTWMARVGAITVSPQVSSGYLSAPDYMGGTKTDVSSNTQLSSGVTYMYTDHWSVDVPVALPFKHQIMGDGALKGAGDLAEVKTLPLTVFLQYRFLQANAKFRPYVGFGLTYAYIYEATGSGKLTATTNPGGPATSLSVDSKWGLNAQIGATISLDDKWFIDLHYSKSNLSTTTHFSTGQQLGIALDPACYGIGIGYRF
ncbi:MAG: OmpW family protein [Comamonadaceae bacterium]|nr:OmpW family protein [Comamonadaceae bacterium]